MPEQAVAIGVGVQHLLLLHSCPVAHVLGQVTWPPHPSLTGPQAMLVQLAIDGMQHLLPLHSCAVAQVLGHMIMPPHPSLTRPQAMPAQLAIEGVQHTLLLQVPLH
jgi:hypothetical protein